MFHVDDPLTHRPNLSQGLLLFLIPAHHADEPLESAPAHGAFAPFFQLGYAGLELTEAHRA